MIKIKPYHLDDVAALAAIANVSMTHAWSKQVFLDCFKANYPGWVAVDHEQIRGFLIANPNTEFCELLNICVDPGFKRQGIGSEMLKAFLGYVKANKFAHVAVEVRMSHQSAIDLFHHFGFIDTGIRQNYYPTEQGREDALLMTCTI